MFKSINVKTVLIQNFELEQEKTKLQKSETTAEQEMKKQNIGKVIMVGGDVDWPKVGMVVKYLRNAATDVVEDKSNTTYQIINKAHVLAELENVKL